jgi:RNA polymerase sigma factor (TIGR02999 family)
MLCNRRMAPAHEQDRNAAGAAGSASAGASSREVDLALLVYDELRRIAAREMKRERKGHTLQPTALVHEAWARLTTTDRVVWSGSAHFVRAASEAMRRILVEHARARERDKRGGGWARVPLDALALADETAEHDLEAFDRALERLASLDPRKADVVKAHCFAGLSLEEIAGHFQLSHATIRRDWRYARAWLRCEMGAEGARELA